MSSCCRTWPQSIIRSYRQACALAVSKVKELSVSLEGKGDEEKRGLLVKCAATSLNSKLVSLSAAGMMLSAQRQGPGTESLLLRRRQQTQTQQCGL
jgi:hypothetical protein